MSPKSLGCSKNIKRKVYSNTSLLQETRKISWPNLTLKGTRRPSPKLVEGEK